MKLFVSTINIYFFFQLILQAQNHSITILDSINDKPINYAYIKDIDKETGIYADIKGRASILKMTECKMIIGALGYEEKEMKCPLPDSIFLQPISYSISEVTVKSNKKIEKEIIGVTKKDKGRLEISTFVPFAQEAIFIPNREKENLKVVTINVQGDASIKNKRNAQLRIRIYSVNKEGLPEKDLLLESHYLRIDGKNWSTLDLSKSEIYIPIDGFFVAVEWVDETGYNEKTSEGISLTVYSPSIRGRRVNKSTGLKWLSFDPNISKWETPNQKINRLNPNLDEHYLDDFAPSINLMIEK